MNIGRSSFILASGTAVSRVLGFVKTILLTMTIGQTGSLAATSFGIANTLPNNIYALIGAGAVNAVLVPLIVRQLRTRDGGEAYISKLLTLCVTAFFIFTVIITLAAPGLVWINADMSEEGLDPAAFELAVALAYWCLPQIFFYAIYTLLGEIYNARGQFGPYTWAPVVNNVVTIAGLALFLVLFGGWEVNRDPTVWGLDRIAAMGLVSTGGVVAQAVVLMLFFRKTGMRFRFDFRWRGVGLRSAGVKASWLLGVVVISQIIAVVQTRVATLGSADGASLLTMYNAWYVFQLPHSIIAVSIAIVFFTQMSNHAADNDIPKLRHDTSMALRAIGMLTTFSAVVLIVVALPLARPFEHGVFDNAVIMATLITANALHLVAFSGQYVLERVSYALEDTRTPFMARLAFLPVSLLALWAASLFPSEYIILAVVSFIALQNTVYAALWLIIVRRKIGAFGIRRVALRHLVYIGLAIPAGAAGAGVVWLLGGYTDGWAHVGVFPAAVTCAIAGVVMLAIYFGALLLFRDPDLRLVTDKLLSRFRRGRGAPAE